MLSFHKLSQVPIHRDYAVSQTRVKTIDDGDTEETFFSISEAHFELLSSDRTIRKELQF